MCRVGIKVNNSLEILEVRSFVNENENKEFKFFSDTEYIHGKDLLKNIVKNMFCDCLDEVGCWIGTPDSCKDIVLYDRFEDLSVILSC